VGAYCGTCGKANDTSGVECTTCSMRRYVESNPLPSSTPTVKAKVRRGPNRRGWVILSVVAAVALLFMYGAASHKDTPQEKDPTGYQACADYTALVEDTQSGTVTDGEFRTRMQSIYDDARYAHSDAVASGARRILADETAGDDDTDDITAMASACVDLANPH
jgi:DNA-directed RNA polymerase subunit RPC12/RpoP